MKPPGKFPDMKTARLIMSKGRLPEHEWPCIKCWGKGCKTCLWEGTGKRSDFAKWYMVHLDAYKKMVQQYNDHLDDCAVDRGTKSFYEPEWLRKVKG